MRHLSHLFLKVLRKAFNRRPVKLSYPKILNADETSDLIIELLNSDKGVMIGRFGSTELAAIVNSIGVKKGVHPISYIFGKQEAWWWNESIMKQMQEWSGFSLQNLYIWISLPK